MLLIYFLHSVFTRDCTLTDTEKLDCGYFGIDQRKCQAKNCCWKPTFQGPNDTPWCFYPKGQVPCKDLKFEAQNPGFTQQDYSKMYSLYMANINIQGKGGVVASPDKTTPGGSYYYHWMRDGALTMRVFMEINDQKLSSIQKQMKSYVNWVHRVQDQVDPNGNGNDIRINPKFQLPNGQVYVGGWCRPQTDGPGLRSGTLIMFANILLDNGQQDYVKQHLWTSSASAYHGGAIKYDLQYIVGHWRDSGCDLWEQVKSNSFFWGQMSFRYALFQGQKLATRLGDTSLASTYRATRASVQSAINTHWTGTFMKQSDNRQKDGSVTHAFSSFPGLFSFTDNKIAQTIKTLNINFCLQFPINVQDNKNGIPGILYGRYPGDSYAGGNPWQLLTAVLGQLFYQGANFEMSKNGDEFLSRQQILAWRDIIKLSVQPTRRQFAQNLINAGDAVMTRLHYHLKSGGGHVSEQIDKNTGEQKSAQDLTWSYANILNALHYRKKISDWRQK